jgi:hypothetical protein
MGVKRCAFNFRVGAMILRYAAAGFLEAEHVFRRIRDTSRFLSCNPYWPD